MQERFHAALRVGAVATLLGTLLVGCAMDSTTGSEPAPTDTADTTPSPAPANAALASPVEVLEPLRPSPELGEWVQTPLGLSHRECVYDVGDDAVVQDDGSILRADGTTFTPPDCSHTEAAPSSVDSPQVNGWTVARTWTIGNWMRKQTANFKVPAAPSLQGGQLIYFFPGSESGNANLNIIQPVLQWGTSPAGGGKRWGISSWYGGNTTHGNYYHSTLRYVSPGDNIAGSVVASSCTSAGSCVWRITTHDTTNGAAATAITTVRLPKQVWVLGGVMEEYGVDHCDQNPHTSIPFTSIAVYDAHLTRVTPHFAQNTWGGASACNSRSSANTSAVTLAYNIRRPNGDTCSASAQCQSGDCGTCPYYRGVCCK